MYKISCYLFGMMLLLSTNVLAQSAVSNAKEIQVLKDLVNQTNTTIEMIRVDTTNKLANVTDRVVTLEKVNFETQNQLKSISARLVTVDADLKQIKYLEQQTFFARLSNGAVEMQNKFGPTLFYIMIFGVIAIVILLIVWLFYPQTARVETRPFRTSDGEVSEILKNDFNPELSSEGIAAKINLARAYIDMGKNEDARVLLHEVMLHGEEPQIIEAKGLLEKIS